MEVCCRSRLLRFKNDIFPISVSDILVEALYLSVDPYMRVYMEMKGYEIGSTMIGGQVSKYKIE